jgi:SIR2-like domain
MAAVDTLNSHVQLVSLGLAEGRVIPFVGAGANLCGRDPNTSFPGDGVLPSGSELARHFATTYAYPDPESTDLLRIAQYVDLTVGDAVLFDDLHRIFAGNYGPNALHRFLAGLPRRLRDQGRSVHGQLIITTNYDDALEGAFAELEEPVDIVHYVAQPNEPGGFVHTLPDGTQTEIPRHTEYRDFALEERSVIFKIHGAVDRDEDRLADSYVITEDHYIDYLALESIAKLIPAYLMARMRRPTSQFLFLGYGLRDWNLRVILRSIWAEQTRRARSWAIQLGPDELDRKFWDKSKVDILDTSLEAWLESMERQLA